MIIEGFNAVTEAIKGELTVERVYIEKGARGERISHALALAKKHKIRVDFQDKERLLALSQTGRHQGIIAVITQFVYTPLEDILTMNKERGTPLLLVLLDGLEDPHNLGAIIRVADSAGADGIVLPARRSVSVTDTVIKTSAGAAAHMPVAKVSNLNDAIRLLKDNFVTVLAADIGGNSIYQADLSGDIAIIIGGEGSGVSALAKKLADGIVSLPQLGQINSLNASVAAGIALYEAVRQRIK
ncbi:MAG: 23S rRNA (guanosine(2251)-2'-O)-methyltransferase RlmB [Clostridia bacterium]